MNTEQQIEFDKVKNIWADLAVTGKAKERIAEAVDEKGVLRVQIADRKIWINHKRVKLHVKAEELYPEDYDFSIVFDDVKTRKIHHDMERKYTEEILEYKKE